MKGAEDLITEEGTIKAVVGQKAWVITHRSEACHQCESKGVCHALGSGKEVEVMADNVVGASVGDKVLLALGSKPLLKATFLIYMVPLLFLIIGAVLGHGTASRLSLSPDLASLLGALLFFVVTLFFVRQRGVTLGKKKQYVPQIVEIVGGVKND